MEKNNEIVEVLRALKRIEDSIKELQLAIVQQPRPVFTSSVPTAQHLRDTLPTHRSNNPTSQLTKAQLAILETVRASPQGVTAQEVQETLGLRSRATVSHNLNDLVRLGLASKQKGKRTTYYAR